MSFKMPKILVAVITYNEELNITGVVQDLRENFPQGDVVVFDNGSDDNTLLKCRELGVEVISNCINSGGFGGTVKSYMLYAYRHNYDVVCQFDGDGQHIAKYLPAIVNPIIEGKADHVIGSRFILKKGFQSSFVRRMGINLFSFLNSRLISQNITDSTSGFRAYSKRVIEFFARYYKHEIYDLNQILLLSYFAGAVIQEVPVEMRSREYGQSGYNFSASLEYIINGLINIVGCYLQKDQINKKFRVNYGP